MNLNNFRIQIIDWYRTDGRDLPWRRTMNPYYIWVSEIMLQQTQVETVKNYYERFIKALPALSDLAGATDDTVFKLWEGLGYYRRVKHMQEAARQIMSDFGGQFPKTYDDIIKLKGIGPYTAAAIASIAFGQPKGVIDGNTLRILSRVYNRQDNIALDKTKKDYQRLMDELIAPKAALESTYNDPSAFNQAMMDLGATLCTPKCPSCGTCPVRTLCGAYAAHTAHILPVNIKNTSKSDIYYITAVLKKDSRYFLIKNNKDGLLENLYGFVQYEVESPVSFEEAFYGEYGLNIRLYEYIKEVKHVFSHRIWHMNVYLGEILDETDENLYTDEEVCLLPVSTAHQKVFRLSPGSSCI